METTVSQPERRAAVEEREVSVAQQPVASAPNGPESTEDTRKTPPVTPTKHVREWIPVALRLFSTVSFIILTLAVGTTIVFLWILSDRQNGLVSVGSTVVGFGTQWRQSVLWTTLPSLLMTILGAHWKSIADAAAFRQPFLELSRPGGATARTSILLDYRTILSLWRWVVAFRNGHHLIAVTLLWSIVLASFTPALSAGLLTTRSTSLSQPEPVLYNVTHDDRAMSRVAKDFGVILDTVSATDIFGSSALPWTLSDYAFTPFYPTGGTDHAPSHETYLTANTTAYSASLNCTQIPSSSYNLKVEDVRDAGIPGSPGVRTADLTLTAVDRACGIISQFTAYDQPGSAFLQIDNVNDCGIDADFGRMVFTYGIADPGSPSLLSNITLISCLSAYTITEGDLKLRLEEESLESPSIVSFHHRRDSVQEKAYLDWRTYEGNILEILNYDTSSRWDTSRYGDLVLYAASRARGVSKPNNQAMIVDLRPSELITAIKAIFVAVYRTTVAMHGFVLLEEALIANTGRLEVPRTRLFVVPWVAGIVLFVLVVGLFLASMIIFLVLNNKTLLFEEPAGLLSMAGILEGSPLMNIAAEVRLDPQYRGQFIKSITTTRLERNAKWRMDASSGRGKWGPVIRDHVEI